MSQIFVQTSFLKESGAGESVGRDCGSIDFDIQFVVRRGDFFEFRGVKYRVECDRIEAWTKEDCFLDDAHFMCQLVRCLSEQVIVPVFSREKELRKGGEKDNEKEFAASSTGVGAFSSVGG